MKTAGPVGGFQDGNYIEVNIRSNTVEFDPNFNEEIVVDSETVNVLKESGNVASRFQTILQPGHYDFEFCYARNRTFEIGPDFVQIDNVDTCAGTSCLGEVPAVDRCQGDQGETLIPDSSVPIYVITVGRVQGTDDRYYVIIDAVLLD